ncbi:MAG: hypothetical protein JJ974_07100 [Phycisphaerales bacterium]|nr:hypothetical protein [Phycisphaerales bacterium]
MSEQSSQPTLEPTRLPILKMAGLSVLACVMIGIAGGAISSMREGSMIDGLLTIAAMFPGVLITLMVLNILPARPAGMWGVPVLAGTMFRAGVVAVIGFGVYLALEPTKELYVLTLLVSLLAVLAIDVLMVLVLVKSVEIVNSEDAPMMSVAPEGQV